MLQTAELLTLPCAADRCGLTYRQALRLVERDLFTAVVPVGRERFVRVEDLDALRAAARSAGYLAE